MARNVDPLQSVITFSEPVSGPLPTSPALTVRSQTAPAGDVWDSSHLRYTLPLDTFAGSVLDVGVVPGLTDDYGNLVVFVMLRSRIRRMVEKRNPPELAGLL